MRKLARAVVLASAFILSLTSAQQAWAWDSPGHMAVAYLAWNQLTPAQQTRVSLLLRSNPYYKKWNGWLKSANVPKADHDRDIFMLAATWPDEIKSDSKYKGTDSIPKGTSTPESGAYGDGHTHKYWHFVDTPYSPDNSSPSDTAPSPNAQGQIIYFAAQLKASGVSNKQKSFDLTWLEHLVGDIHQPLHATTRYTAGTSDSGGNGITLTSPSTHLHTYWDDLPGKDSGSGANQIKDIAVAIEFADAAPKPTPAEAQNIDVSKWTTESVQLAETDAYASPITKDTTPVALNQTYSDQAMKDAQSQIALAGARLAALLQANLV